MTDVRFIKKIRATRGTRYDLFKGRDTQFVLDFLKLRQKFILNCRYTPPKFDIQRYKNRKLNDYFTPALSRKNLSMAGVEIKKALSDKFEQMLEPNEAFTLKIIQTLVEKEDYSIM